MDELSSYINHIDDKTTDLYMNYSSPVNTELCSCMYSDIKRLSDLHDYICVPVFAFHEEKRLIIALFK